jgi:predicted ATPase
MSDYLSPNAPFVRGIQLVADRVPASAQYPFDLPWMAQLNPLKIESPVTFLVGENGTGKSTLMEAIATAWGFNAEGGSRNFNFETRGSHSKEFSNAIRLIKGVSHPKDGFFLRAESFFNVATNVEDLGLNGYGAIPLHEQSHGESFYSLFQDRFGGHGFYLLDEPEAALSLNRQFGFLVRLKQLVEQRSQFIIATHSPILMAFPGASILELTAEGLNAVAYDQVEQVGVWRHFLNNPQKMLDRLLGEEQGELRF